MKAGAVAVVVAAACAACGDNIVPERPACMDMTDIATCGASCTPCTSPAHASATCDGIACGFACDPGYHGCESACVDDLDVDTCGASCSPCPAAPTNATATCDGIACGFACEPGYASSQGACSLTPPRPISPLSTATVTTRRPTLRWELATGTDGARVELCLDRACANVIDTIDVTGSAISPAADLPVGTVFWRLYGRVGMNVGNDTSPTWQLVVRAHTTPTDGWFGTVLDVNGDGFADVAVGAPRGSNNYGRVYVFVGSAAGLGATPAASLTGPDGEGFFGWSVASAGDVNGDGFADLIVGAPYYPGVPWAGTMAGRAYVYLGGATGLATSPTTLVAPDGDGSIFGQAVAFAGDINGDGYADVAIGAIGTNGGAGTVYIYFGSALGIATTPAITIAGTDGAHAAFGYAVVSAGDLDGDGYGELAIGAPLIQQGAGLVHVYFGSASGLATTPFTLNGPAGTGDMFGLSITADDFDGDGYADLVVGEPGVNIDWGAACVYPGGATGLMATPAITYAGAYESEAGTSVASAGDVDGDGYADLVVGKPSAAAPAPLDYTIGEADVYLGGAAGLRATPSAALSIGIDGYYSAFGFAIGPGDVDGDGHDDVVIGAPTYADVGAAFVFPGMPGAIATAPATEWTGPDASGAFGQAVY